MSFVPPVMTTLGSYSTFYTNGNGIGTAGTEADYNSMTRYGRTNNERMASMALGRGGFRGMRRAMRVLNGAAAGSAASETHTRVAVQTPFQPETAGGLRSMETVTDITGNTTSAQQAYIQSKILDMMFGQTPVIPTGYPADLSGNGSRSLRGY